MSTTRPFIWGYAGTIDPDHAHRIVGIVEGEGCFSISKTTKGDGYVCSFKVKMRSDDEELLQWMMGETGLGTIHRGKGWRGDGATRQSWSCWTVQNKRDLRYLTEFFDAYPLRSKKRHDYLIWREAVIDWMCHGPGDSWEPIAKAHDDLKTAREFKEGSDDR